MAKVDCPARRQLWLVWCHWSREESKSSSHLCWGKSWWLGRQFAGTWNRRRCFRQNYGQNYAFFLPKKNTDVLVARFCNDHETIMQYYSCLWPETAKCEFHNTGLEIKQHLQETVRNRKLAKKSVRDRYGLEKLLEELLCPKLYSAE